MTEGLDNIVHFKVKGASVLLDFLLKKDDNLLCLPENSVKYDEQREGGEGEGRREMDSSVLTGQ